MGDEKSETAIVAGIQVLLALLDISQNGVTKFSSTQNLYGSNVNDESSDSEQKQKSVLSTTQVIKDRIKDFHNLLIDPPKVRNNTKSRRSTHKHFKNIIYNKERWLKTTLMDHLSNLSCNILPD